MERKFFVCLFVTVALLQGIFCTATITAFVDNNEPDHSQHAKMARYIVHRVGEKESFLLKSVSSKNYNFL